MSKRKNMTESVRVGLTLIASWIEASLPDMVDSLAFDDNDIHNIERALEWIFSEARARKDDE